MTVAAETLLGHYAGQGGKKGAQILVVRLSVPLADAYTCFRKLMRGAENGKGGL